MNKKMQSTVDPSGRQLYRVAGISAFVLVIGYFLTIPIYMNAGIAPTGAEAQLIHYAPHLTDWWFILGLMVFTDLLYIPVWLALYQALKGINRNLMVLALACHGLFVVLDLALTWPNYAIMFNLSPDYVMAATDVQRATIVASASSAAAVLDSPMLRIIAILIPSLGTFLSGFVVLKGIFGKGAAYLAFAVGVTGILAAVGPLFTEALGTMHIINALLATFWYLAAGWKLYKISRQTN
jgi:hypothetical protein